MPFLLLLRLVETQPERIHRLHRHGWSQQRIADQLGITRHRVRKALSQAAA
ncbi:helix-turn-helix domain-containing protein [Synechococcus sp. CS-205]|uniref:helix-turn-helix domain-containing protein n=1 Tax=Synechococcus sp. CS-205 TaxID=2847984 RepID=UPI00223B1583|nr:helix-turn-helix domain-containing protein [Synechococcus sp. CS-205]MCT0247470.1 helix-turn-helix domain-containing protein [Synechococcus sp. CS-205]